MHVLTGKKGRVGCQELGPHTSQICWILILQTLIWGPCSATALSRAKTALDKPQHGGSVWIHPTPITGKIQLQITGKCCLLETPRRGFFGLNSVDTPKRGILLGYFCPVRSWETSIECIMTKFLFFSNRIGQWNRMFILYHLVMIMIIMMIMMTVKVFDES